MMNDKPLKTDDATVPVWLPQDHVDGLCCLIKWLDGFEAAGKGRVPGHFELVMHYRNIATALHEAKQKSEKN